jgi:hemoglobin-like flavoprotein
MSRSPDPLSSSQLPANGTFPGRTRTLAFGPPALAADMRERLLLEASPARIEAPPARIEAPTALLVAPPAVLEVPPARTRPPRAGVETLMGMPISAPVRDAGPALASISPRTILVVQHSWAQLLPFADVMAALFFDRLLELEPSRAPHLQEEIAARRDRLVQTLSLVVDGLSEPAELVPMLEALGAQHPDAVKDELQRDRVGEAMMWTLREGLCDDFTYEVEWAWAEAYSLVWSVLRQGGASRVGAGGALRRLDAVVLPPKTSRMFDVRSLAAPPTVTPAARPKAPRVAWSGLVAGAALTALCTLSSVASTLLLGSRGAGGLSGATLLGVPPLLLVLVSAAFCLGRFSLDRRAEPRRDVQ